MNDINWWWLSFADEEKGFLGATIIAAESFKDAHIISHYLKINPGGQVHGLEVNFGGEKIITLSETFRLLNKTEAKNLSDRIEKILMSDSVYNQT